MNTWKKHPIKEGSKVQKLSKLAEASLGSGNLRLAVKVPEGEDLNEWLAYNGMRRNTHIYCVFLLHFVTKCLK